MALQILPTYLNDHLAGSIAAVELLDHRRALTVAAERVPQIRKLDLGALVRRAMQQHERVETERLKVASAALAT